MALLRAIQNNEVVPVGSTRAVSIDLRVVCATHAPLQELVEGGTFRADLHARLAGFTFRVPPLRDRMEDFGVIVARLLDELKPEGGPTAMDPEAVTALLSHTWPYNARGLRQCLASALALANGDRLQLSHLPEEIMVSPEHPPDDRVPQRLPESDLRALLIRRFEEHDGNVTQVARSMGKARVQIQRWMKRFEIDPSEYR